MKHLDKYNFVFLQGIRVRSGTNYLGKLMSYHPGVQFLSAGSTREELPLLGTAASYNVAFEKLRKYFVNSGGTQNGLQFSTFARHLGDAWLSYVVEAFSVRPGHIFIKDPHVDSIDRFFDFFPNAKLLILVRDGRDNVASSVKASMAVRKSMSASKRLSHQINHLIMRDFIAHALGWARSARIIQEFDENFRNTSWATKYKIIRYEDVYHEPLKLGKEIFDFVNLECNESILSTIQNAEVVGSSFYSPDQRENAHKPNWTPTPKTETFRPVGRWRKWGKARKRLFKILAGKELAAFGYEKDLAW